MRLQALLADQELDPELVWMRQWHSAARGARDSARAALDTFAAPVLTALASGFAWASEPALSQRLARRAIAASAPGDALEARAHLTLAEIALGRWRAAYAQLDTIAASDATAATVIGASLILVPMVPATTEDLQVLRRRVEALAPESPPNLPEYHPQQLHVFRRVFLLGALSARLGRMEEAQAHVATLQEQEYEGPWKHIADSFAPMLRAWIAAEAGAWEQADAELARVTVLSPPSLGSLAGLGLEVAPWLRAETAFQLGRDEEARRRFQNLSGFLQNELALLGPRHLRLAQLADRNGNREDAARHYREFLDVWAVADSALQPMVRDAAARLAALQPAAPR